MGASFGNLGKYNLGYLKNNPQIPVSWVAECPIHAGVTNLDYPTGSNYRSTATEYMAEILYCPSGLTSQNGVFGSGHTFPLEMANATIFAGLPTSFNTTVGTGLVGNTSVALYSGVPVLQYLSWF